jgi:hypothetical protein
MLRQDGGNFAPGSFILVLSAVDMEGKKSGIHNSPAPLDLLIMNIRDISQLNKTSARVGRTTGPRALAL